MKHWIVLNIFLIAQILEDGQKLKDLIESQELHEYFQFHDTLSDHAFCQQIYESNYLWPLLGVDNAKYLFQKNTASYSQSARYKKPMILTKENAEAWSIPEDCCLVYEDLDELYNKLVSSNDRGASMAENYSRFIKNKIEENQGLLRSIYERNIFVNIV